MKKYANIILIIGTYIITGALCWLQVYLNEIATKTFSLWLMIFSKLTIPVMFLVGGIVLAIVLLNKQEQSKIARIIENVLLFAPVVVMILGIVLYAFTMFYIIAPFSYAYLSCFSLALLFAGAKAVKLLVFKNK